jgi:hypothetical protein
MTGYLPAGVTQDVLDRLIEDEAPEMEWDSANRCWVPVYPDYRSDEDTSESLGFEEDDDYEAS